MLVMMGISGTEGHAGQTIFIWWYNMLCMKPRWIIINHYSGFMPWQWFHTPKVTLDGAMFCMMAEASHDGDTQC